MINQTYYNPVLWKTNAPPEVVYDVIKAFKQQSSPDLIQNVSENSYFYNFLKQPMKHQPNFNIE